MTFYGYYRNYYWSVTANGDVTHGHVQWCSVVVGGVECDFQCEHGFVVARVGCGACFRRAVI